jgi:hypothetical protein
MKICSKCQTSKPIEEFDRDSRFPAPRRMAACKVCRSKRCQQGGSYYEKHLENCKIHRDKNKEYKKTYNKAYVAKRMAEDVLFRLRINLSQRLNQAMRRKEWKKYSKFNTYTGCNRKELGAYLESKFKPGMSWSNYGLWEIDHIKPLSKAKNEEEMCLRCHFSNLQPLWKEENRRKSNKD